MTAWRHKENPSTPSVYDRALDLGAVLPLHEPTLLDPPTYDFDLKEGDHLWRMT